MITTSTTAEQGRNMENIRDIIDAANGKFFSVRFLKKDGTVRDMVCRTVVKKYLKGGNDLIQELENILGVGLNVVTPDGQFSVEAVRCLGCCGLAPVLSVNGTMHGNLKKEDVAGIVAQYQTQAQA